MSKITKFGLPFTFIAAGALLSPLAHAAAPGHPANPADAIVTELMTKALPDIPGKDAVMITVDYPPGAVDPVHRHDAYSFVYVLEGSIVMQVKGGKEVTLTPGQTFFEGPDDIHTVGRNASQSQPAKFVVVLIKKKGAPILTPIQ
ncbi:cupin domain-containing protein [Achromobacter spanius]|uniref:Cupin domain-containing protein n=1 Tax=Achromobacter spanius TaxID=217203 RepID=A0AA42LS80_9BURK|nr:cupin domain-containing protein [Achromobacter spanius]MDH0738510.1 cupin domain-containing protein [Achromobacter spanius]